MRTLLLARHAKSDWNAAFDEDHERPLNARGRVAARVMGRFLARARQAPDGIVCSSATRARETLERLRAAAEWPLVAQIEPSLYAAHRDDVLGVVRRLSDDLQSVLLVGHEPTTSDTARALVGLGMPAGTAPLRFPTAAVARIDLDVDRWSEVEEGRGQLIWLVPPKLLTDDGFGLADED